METTVDASLARRLVEPLYKEDVLMSGERALAHADAMVEILKEVRPEPELLAAAYLFYVPAVIQQNSGEWIEKSFSPAVNSLVQELARINKLQQLTKNELGVRGNAQEQAEAVRKMLIAMCNDLRVVLLKLASRLQTLRFLLKGDPEIAKKFGENTLAVYAPLANRLGIWQMKWELEDLSLRLTHPDEYHEIARQLDESREDRLKFMQVAVAKVRELLKANHIEAEISGRPKHIYSIWKKMQRKNLRFDQLFDVRAMRIIVSEVPECYQVLSIVQESFPVLSKEYDDYIAKPKPNGYQSLHTVITDTQGRPIEVQIRTRAMHEFAELGVAAHWRYKEAGNSNGATSAEEQRVAWLRQLLAWGSDLRKNAQTEGEGEEGAGLQSIDDDHVYVLTPQGRVLELPVGSTPVDFAYLIHTELGHRTRGAKVDGVMVPLNTPLKTGQTVEIIAGKTGQPSRDWLTAELGYAVSQRTRNKVRQWFNAQQAQQMTQEGRDKLDKELARLGKTAIKLEDLAKRLGYDGVDELSLAYAKEEISAQALALAVQPPKPPQPEPEVVEVKEARHAKDKSDVLVVGVDSLLTQLARCCHPVPPDDIIGYVTRGHGVTIHRTDCPNVRNMSEQDHERLIEVSWGNQRSDSVYPVDVLIVTQERPGLLKDVSEIFVRQKQHVIGMSSQRSKGDMRMRFTIEINSVEALQTSLSAIRELPGVLNARRV